MMLQKIFLLASIVTALLSLDNPKLYAPLGDRLYNANSKFESFAYDEALSGKIRTYHEQSNLLKERGLFLDGRADLTADERAAYLSSLRMLENDYDRILHLLRQMLIHAIEDDDYATFAKICIHAPSTLWDSPGAASQAKAYYRQHLYGEKIAPLEQLIQDEKLAQQAVRHSEQKNSGVYVSQKVPKRSGIQVDQEHIPIGGRGGLEITANQTVAQSFSIAQNGRLIALDLIDIKHHRCTPTKSLYVSLVTMENGRLGPYSYYTRELHPNEISPTTRLYFGSYGPMVKTGEQYAIYLKTNAEPGGCTYAWSGDYQTYNGGKTFINEMENIRDMKFRSYVLIN